MLTLYKQKQNATVVPSDLLKAHTLWKDKDVIKFTYIHILLANNCASFDIRLGLIFTLF